MNYDPMRMIRTRLNSVTQAALARELGISKGYLHDVISGRREPGAKLCEALGLEIVYRKKKG
jgi:transcriptional regulator with XRE-family HTH domain